MFKPLSKSSETKLWHKPRTTEGIMLFTCAVEMDMSVGVLYDIADP